MMMPLPSPRGPPDHGHGEGIHRVVEVEGGIGLDEGDVVRKGRPRHSEQEAADSGGEELEAESGDAPAHAPDRGPGGPPDGGEAVPVEFAGWMPCFRYFGNCERGTSSAPSA